MRSGRLKYTNDEEEPFIVGETFRKASLIVRDGKDRSLENLEHIDELFNNTEFREVVFKTVQKLDGAVEKLKASGKKIVAWGDLIELSGVIDPICIMHEVAEQGRNFAHGYTRGREDLQIHPSFEPDSVRLANKYLSGEAAPWIRLGKLLNACESFEKQVKSSYDLRALSKAIDSVKKVMPPELRVQVRR